MPFTILFAKKLSIFQAFAVLTMLALVMFFGFKMYFEDKIEPTAAASSGTEAQLKSIRNMNSYKYARPLIAVDMSQQSIELNPIKKSLTSLIEKECSDGNLFQASLYLRDMQTGEWATVNEDLSYHPGSLIKVPMLIYYLKESERDPSILDKQFTYHEDKVKGMPAQTYSNHSIVSDKPYTVRELLKYMASYSDNHATFLLNKNADVASFQKIFADLGLTVPDIHDTNYSITVKDYSLFLRVLYNATYLNAENSDLALTLLTESSFKEGLAKELPADMMIARKFGEMNMQNKRELHESGIIYCNKTPYLVTVMTKGYNPANQASVISKVSEMIYKYLCI